METAVKKRTAMHRLLRLAVMAVLVAPTAAWAADVPARYVVDLRDLKRNAVAGTPLTFQLYTDSVCSASTGAPVIVNVEDLDLIEQVKAMKVKHGPRPQKVARLNQLLTGVPEEATYFLEVTAPVGITPVGGVCQAQAAGAAGQMGTEGEQGPAGQDGADGAQGPVGPKGDTGDTGPQGAAGQDGAQGPAGPKGDTGNQGPEGLPGQDGADGAVAALFDSLGQYVGNVIGAPAEDSKVGFVRIVDGIPVRLKATPDSLQGWFNSFVRFENSDCTGNAYLNIQSPDPRLFPYAGITSTGRDPQTGPYTVYIQSGGHLGDNFPTSSNLYSHVGDCNSGFDLGSNLVPAEPHSFPSFVPPFHIEGP